MRLLRVLSSLYLPCGCLVGVYECFDARTVWIVDERDRQCADHADGRTVASAYAAPPEFLRDAAAATTALSPTSPTRLGKT